MFQSPEAVVLRIGHEMTGLEARHADALREGKATPEPMEREWRSVRALPRREHTYLRPRAR